MVKVFSLPIVEELRDGTWVHTSPAESLETISNRWLAANDVRIVSVDISTHTVEATDVRRIAVSTLVIVYMSILEWTQEWSMITARALRAIIPPSIVSPKDAKPSTPSGDAADVAKMIAERTTGTPV